jgi:hypothetical protein
MARPSGIAPFKLKQESQSSEAALGKNAISGQCVLFYDTDADEGNDKFSTISNTRFASP